MSATTIERPLRLVENLWIGTYKKQVLQVFHCSQTLDDEMRPNRLCSIWAGCSECQTVTWSHGLLVGCPEGALFGEPVALLLAQAVAVLFGELDGVVVRVAACTGGDPSSGAPSGRSGTDTSTYVQATWRARYRLSTALRASVLAFRALCVAELDRESPLPGRRWMLVSVALRPARGATQRPRQGGEHVSACARQGRRRFSPTVTGVSTRSPADTVPRGRPTSAAGCGRLVDEASAKATRR